MPGEPGPKLWPVHLDGAASYGVGDEIWHESLADAIRAEADRIVGEVTAALVSAGDRYRAPDGVLYSLLEESSLMRPVAEVG